VAKALGKRSPRETSRCAGDSAEIVADSSRLQSQLGWSPAHDDLKRSSPPYGWERLNSHNFAAKCEAVLPATVKRAVDIATRNW
jgi:UDP-glucose 4-epimerase